MVPPDTLKSLIVEGLKEDTCAKEAHTALGLLGGGGLEHRVFASLLRHYQLYWSEQEELLYNKTLLYVPAEGCERQEVLRRHHNNLIAGHFGVHCTFELVARKYYWLGLLRDIQTSTEDCLMC